MECVYWWSVCIDGVYVLVGCVDRIGCIDGLCVLVGCVYWWSVLQLACVEVADVVHSLFANPEQRTQKPPEQGLDLR